MTARFLTNVRLIDPASGLDAPGHLLIEDGRIAAFGADVSCPNGIEPEDCGGRVLMPGLIDMRSFAPDRKAAAAGGITTTVLQPNRTPPIDNDAMIIRAAANGGGNVRVRVMGAATRALAGEAMAEIGLMAEAGAVAFTDGRTAVADSELMRRILEYAGMFGGLIVQHAEDPSLANGGVMHEGEIATRLGLPAIPDTAEAIILERDRHLVALTGGRYHAAQVSSARGLDVVRRAKADGLAVSCGVSPHHLTLNETAIGDYRTFAKTSPPLRSEDDRRALVAGLADGTIDVICSSHDPQDEDAKRLPFLQAADGVLGYQTMLPLALALYHKGEAELMTVLKAMTSRPAELLGLGAGRLTADAPADLILVNLDAPWQVDPDALLSPTRNTPFEGMPVQGRVEETLVAGRTVFKRPA